MSIGERFDFFSGLIESRWVMRGLNGGKNRGIERSEDSKSFGVQKSLFEVKVENFSI
jgi:hypothetical protein